MYRMSLEGLKNLYKAYVVTCFYIKFGNLKKTCPLQVYEY
jgi:hypothetical protein